MPLANSWTNGGPARWAECYSKGLIEMHPSEARVTLSALQVTFQVRISPNVKIERILGFRDLKIPSGPKSVKILPNV